jgi:hypothetical protein
MTFYFKSIIRDRTYTGSDAAPLPYRSVPVCS